MLEERFAIIFLAKSGPLDSIQRSRGVHLVSYSHKYVNVFKVLSASELANVLGILYCMHSY